MSTGENSTKSKFTCSNFLASGVDVGKNSDLRPVVEDFEPVADGDVSKRESYISKPPGIAGRVRDE